MDLASFPIRHEKPIVFLVVVLSLLGVWAYLNTPASIFPEMRFSRVDVVADAGNLPPEQVRVAVTLPLERELIGLPLVRRVMSTSAQGSSEIVVEFDPATDAQADLQLVEQAIGRARSSLPGDADVQATVITPQSEPILSYGITSTQLSQTLVREFAQQNVAPELFGIPGLARVLVLGGPQREFRVTLDPAALGAVGLSAQDVSAAIGTAANVQAVGLEQQFSQRRALLVDAGLHGAGALRALAIPTAGGASVPLGSLGSVELTTGPPQVELGYDGRPAVVMSAFASPHADVVRMGGEVKARLAAIGARLPGDMKITPYWDQTTLIVDSQASLRDAILVGALLAIAVIFFFLRDLRMTAAAAIVVPSAMAIAVLALAAFGQTLNIMSVGGLAIAVGLIIDDAIVVIEGIARTMGENPELPMTEAIVSTMRRLIGPMTASTLTTVVVFVPLAMLGGVTGSFFRALALTLSSALIVSLALAIFATPIFVRSMLAGRPVRPENPAIHNALERYEPILRWALGHRTAVYAGAGVVLALTVALLVALPSDFLPQLDEGQFEIKYTMPVGTTLAASDAAARRMERAVLADPAVASTGRQTGVDTNGFSPTPPRVGTVRVGLKQLSQRDGYDAVSDRIRDAVAAAVPSAQLDVHQILEDMIDDVSGAPAPVEIEVSGPDPKVLADSAQRIADRISSVPGVADAFSGVVLDDPATHIVPDFARLARSGVDASQLAAAVEAGSTGTVDTSLPEPSMLVPVRVVVAGIASGLPDSVALRSGNLALGDLAATRVDRSSQDVTQLNGRRVTIVTANVNGRSLSAVVGDVRAAIDRAGLPPGYAAVIGGAYRLQQDSFREFVQVILVALLLVFFVMLVSFSSYRQPLVILTAVPLALIGVALGLFVTRTPFNVSSFMGLLLLVGIVVKNGILLIDAANRRRAEGFARTDALVLAGRERLRPILMTTFAAIGGLLPLAFGIGAGAAMERPLAIAVVGGLSTATAFTLVLIPVLYDAFVAKETA